VTVFAGGRGIGSSADVTDAEGSFTVFIPAEITARPGLLIGVIVEHDAYMANPDSNSAYSLARLRQNESLGERPPFQRIQLHPAAPLKGKFLTPDGRPAVGVKIKGFTRQKSKDYTPITWLETTTDFDGTFQLKLVKDGVAAIWVLPDDFAIFEKVLDQQAGDLGDIRLVQGTRITGQVLTADGKTAPGIHVDAHSGNSNSYASLHGVGSGITRSATTDAEGRFTMNPLPPGDYRVQPGEGPGGRFPNGSQNDVYIAHTVKLTEGLAATPVVLRAAPHVHVHLQYLTSQGTRTGGHRFSVAGEMDSTFWRSSVEPSNEGTATARIPRGLKNVRVLLTSSSESSLRFRLGPGKPAENWSGTIELGDLHDDFHGLEIIRYKAPVALVHAVDEAGTPIQGIQVAATYPWKKNRYSRDGELPTDIHFVPQDDGRHRSTQLLPDEEITFTVVATGFQSASTILKLPEGETKDVVLTLKKPD
jgi:hypothetical protein